MTSENDAPGGDEGIPLRTLGDVEREMARVYRDMRKGRIEVPHGNGLTQTLQYLAKVKRETIADELLQRMTALEQKQAKAEEQASAH